MGWHGSTRHGQRYEAAYLILAGLSAPLVLSVHSIVSLDFAVGIVPGWHTTIFPPYFVAGAVFAGFAMVLTLAIPERLVRPQRSHYDEAYRLVRQVHADDRSGLLLHGYLTEAFYGWYAGGRELEISTNRASVPMAGRTGC